MDVKQRKTTIEWKKYFFELIVIITGITISFTVQNWQEAKANRIAGLQVLERIHDDLKEDTASMRAEIATLKDISRYSEKLLAFSQVDEIADSLNIYLGYQMQYSVFTKTDIGYRAVQQGGASKLISNKMLLDKIIRLYAIRYKEVEEYGDIDKTFMLGQFIPYFNENFPFVANLNFQAFGAEKFSRDLQSDVFKNLLRTNSLLKKQGVIRYEVIIREIAELMAAIEQEMEALR